MRKTGRKIRLIVHQEVTRAASNGGSSYMGTGGATQQWVDENYLSKEFFNQMFETKVRVVVTDYTAQEVLSDTTRVLAPNEIVVASSSETDPDTQHVITTTMTITDIQAKAGLWTQSYLSALGQNTGGGGGGASALYNLVDVKPNSDASPTRVYGLNGTAADDGKVLAYSTTYGKWIAQTVQSGGGSVTSITAGTGLSGGTITSSGTIAISSTYQGYINEGHTAYGWGNHATEGYLKSIDATMINTALGFTLSGTSGATYNLANFLTGITSQMVTNALGYTPVSNATTWWGRSVNNNVVVGNIDMNNGDAINFKNSGGTPKSVLTLNQNNILIIGYGTNNSDYATQLRGAGISFYTYNNSAEVNVGEFSKSGRFWIKQATQGLRIGDGLLTWDASNNSLKVSDASGNAANLYALGGISALGFSSGSGSTAIDSLTVNSDIFVKDYADNSLKALSVTKATSSSGTNYLIIGDGWTSANHETVIKGANIRFSPGSYDSAVTINGAGMMTFNAYCKSTRYYLDSTRYLYLSGSSLYFYNGSTSVQIA